MKKHGFTLIELLVVMAIFSVVGIVSAQSLLSVFTTGEKSQSTVLVRENIENSFSVLERELRNARSLDTCSSNVFSGITFVSVVFTDQNSTVRGFICQYRAASPSFGNISIDGSTLTSTQVIVTNCTASCDLTTADSKGSVDLTVTAHSADASTSVTDSELTLSTFVQLRSNY